MESVDANERTTLENVTRTRALLETKCNRGLSCMHRSYFPQVRDAGPIALNSTLINLLRRGLHCASANETSLHNLI